MPKQPSAIIIVRHGTRLDQADKNWRTTAEHPYDPPLSYGGWIQCQTLGARIDRELTALEHALPPDSSQPPPKRRKIIIHSSPYKRCVQTSIAIAAGLRYPTNTQIRPLPTPFQRNSQSYLRNSVSDAATPNGNQASETPSDEKIELKIDPCLGEWLSTSYFDSSEEPPPADIIVDRAKETMTRPLEEIRGADLNAFLPVQESEEDETAMGSQIPPSSSVPRRIIRRQRAKTLNVYSPPVPQYSLAPQDSIPAGYVAHARDACVAPNTDWDSIALGWGDAGTYPEDWGVMHVRFRLALQKILAHYEDYTIPSAATPNSVVTTPSTSVVASTDLPAQPATSIPADPAAEDNDNEIEDELVLVLVTHQAGANALIRLMTGAPALHDVGVASLTLAIRRPVLHRPPSLPNTSHSPLAHDRESRRNTRRGSLDLGLADDFEMKVIASTDHLRIGSNPLGLNSPRLGSPSTHARRHTAQDSLDGFSIGDSLAWRPNTNANTANAYSKGTSMGMAMGMSRSGSQRRGVEAVKIQTGGLWGSPASRPIEEEEMPMSPKSRPVSPDFMVASPVATTSRSRSNTVQSGLWGSGNVPVRSGSGTWMQGDWTANVRSKSPAKRRWTAVSNSDS